MRLDGPTMKAHVFYSALLLTQLPVEVWYGR